MNHLLELRNVTKYFSSSPTMFSKKEDVVKAVDGVSLNLAEGETLSIVGESGCGKTTLARLIIRLYDCDSGSILFRAQDITRLKGSALKPVRQNIQMVFQDPYSSLDPRFIIRRIIEEPMMLDSTRFPSQQSRLNRVEELLKAVGLKSDMMIRYPHEFSGGERQRIAIARALVMNPKLLILDEAVSSLDVIIQRQILDLLKSLQKQFGLSYIFITHNLRVAKFISDKIAVMMDGKIIEEASSEQLFSSPKQNYTKQLLKASVEYKVSSI